MRKLKLKTYQLQSRKRELEFFLSNFYNDYFVSENDVTIGKDTNQDESLEKLKQENLKEKIKILEKEISKNCLEKPVFTMQNNFLKLRKLYPCKDFTLTFWNISMPTY